MANGCAGTKRAWACFHGPMAARTRAFGRAGGSTGWACSDLHQGGGLGERRRPARGKRHRQTAMGRRPPHPGTFCMCGTGMVLSRPLCGIRGGACCTVCFNTSTPSCRAGESFNAPLPPPRPPSPPTVRHPEQPSTPQCHADDHADSDELHDAVGPLGDSGTPPGIKQKRSVSLVDAHDPPVGVPPSSDTTTGANMVVVFSLYWCT